MPGLLAELYLRQTPEAATIQLAAIGIAIGCCVCWLMNVYKNTWITQCCRKVVKECTCQQERVKAWMDARCNECGVSDGDHAPGCTQNPTLFS